MKILTDINKEMIEEFEKKFPKIKRICCKGCAMSSNSRPFSYCGKTSCDCHDRRNIESFITKVLTFQQTELKNMVRKLANEYAKTDETLLYSQALLDFLKLLK